MTRTAPPRLVYVFERPPRAAGLCLLAVALAGACGVLLWALMGAGPRPWPAAVGLLLWMLVAACGLRCWQRWPEGQLEWDGAQWWLRPQHARRALPLAGAPQLRWDGQGFVLLGAALAQGGQRWLWLQRSSAPALWGDLRRAVYWRARPVEHA
ncbi:hypothetical protein D3C78_1323110 [compost metagenome]